MTRFTVTWHPDEENRLAEIWMQAGDRSAVAAAADRVDRELNPDGDQKGTPLVDDVRLLVVSPLAVIYQVLEEDRQLKVLQIMRQ